MKATALLSAMFHDSLNLLRGISPTFPMGASVSTSAKPCASPNSKGSTGSVPTPGRRPPSFLATQSLWLYLTTTLICVVVLTGIYRLDKISLSIPLDSYGDGLFYQAIFKNFIETGHWNINPRLGAPGEQELYDFPVPHSTHLIGFALLRLFTRNFELVFNLYYLATYPLAAITALYVLRRFKISAGLAVALAVLYAFLPYHLMRSELHYILACYYLVPLAVMVALWLATGVPLLEFHKTWMPRPTREGTIAILTCILIAGDNPYYAFFAGIFLVCGGLLGQFRYRIPRTAISTLILSAVLAGSLIANLAPNFVYQFQHGSNPVAARQPGEAEVYGLKIVQLVAPVTNHRVGWLAKWKVFYRAQTPSAIENDFVTLGLIGAFGLFILLGVFFVAPTSHLMYALAVLNLSALLYGTVGGLGSLFSFAIWPQFRALNRLSIFIGFVCLFAIGLVIDGTVAKSPARRWALYVLVPLLLVIGLADQIPTQFRQPHAALEAQFRSMDSYFSSLEASLPAGSMIFQLPYVSFPLSVPPNQLDAYAGLLPYLRTSTLHWSYASMEGRDADHWNAHVGSEPVFRMVETVAAAGFAGILIDRFGYADRAASLEAQLQPLIQENPVVSSDGRYAFFSLTSFTNTLKSRYSDVALDELAHPVYADMEEGCWPLETQAGKTWNWCRAKGELVVYNPSKETREVEVEITFRTDAWDPPADIFIQGPGIDTDVKANTLGKLWKEKLRVPPGRSVYTLHSNAAPAYAPSDSRRLIFMVSNLKVSEATD